MYQEWKTSEFQINDVLKTKNASKTREFSPEISRRGRNSSRNEQDDATQKLIIQIPATKKKITTL